MKISKKIKERLNYLTNKRVKKTVIRSKLSKECSNGLFADSLFVLFFDYPVLIIIGIFEALRLKKKEKALYQELERKYNNKK